MLPMKCEATSMELFQSSIKATKPVEYVLNIQAAWAAAGAVLVRLKQFQHKFEY